MPQFTAQKVVRMLNYAWGGAHQPVRRISSFSCCGISVRSFGAADYAAAKHLHREGRLTARRRQVGVEIELEDVLATYFARQKDHFWVAECTCEIVGIVAMTIDDQRVGHLRRLRVDPTRQHQCGYIAALLMERATAHARCYDCLKLLVHTQADEELLIPLLRELRFEFSRRRDHNGREELEFYINLYGLPKLFRRFNQHCPLDGEGFVS